ncbi:ribose-phosphate pyrophosphokinase [Marinospirillum alkaliphilum]|uniref:Ribose-phosphate pyrophosphokinase n=1 Tax=Marinospirillum alkaliphilum DSM 21637 TaxID=1122209 RepID=A0A1K2A290_9GAMM|nr:ribose-phosphate pyrophosphokinase [Marinospirillum alkaliphilum]SFX79829.1 ribose-phosphate pyrophosphokinase [Marinospirillum alkaliphilum DSM 21637]
MKQPLVLNLDALFEQQGQPASTLAKALAEQLQAEIGTLDYRQFPDGESYLRVDSPVGGRDCLVVCSLHDPNPRFLPLIFAAEVLRELGASRIALVAPYLCYMRQDKRFQAGECITSRHFAALISRSFDFLITVDPHLHRYQSLDEIYGIPSLALTSAASVARWLQQTVKKPLLLGPDSESEQWVAQVAQLANAPFEVLEKVRSGDLDVAVSVPHVQQYLDHTPVLVDDIISSGRTLLQTVEHLQKAGMKPAICIGTHGLFSAGAWELLQQAHTSAVVTSNSVPHPSNAIDLAPALAEGLQQWLEHKTA